MDIVIPVGNWSGGVYVANNASYWSGGVYVANNASYWSGGVHTAIKNAIHRKNPLSAERQVL